MKKNAHFSLLAFVLCLVSVPDAMAAPSIKRFGTFEATPAKTGTTTAKSKITSLPRTTSAVKLTGSTVKATDAIKALKTTVPDTARLSVGKYLHKTGVVNKTIPVNTGGISGADADDIRARMDRIESDYALKSEADAMKESIDALLERVGALEESGIPDLVGLTERVAEIENNYATKAEVNELSNTVTQLKQTVDAMTGVAGLADDWGSQGPEWGQSGNGQSGN